MRSVSETGSKNAVNRLILGLGIAYFLFLAWAILWKCGTPFIGDGTVRAINLLPFHNNAQWEMQFNIGVFMPFGFYLAAYKPKPKFIKLIAVSFLVSFALELVQFALAIGRSDITDLLLNTLGGTVGIAVFYILSKLFGKYARKAILVVCIFLALLALYMTVSFVLFGQLNLGFMMIRLL
jgi:glycopeptide antibiotics resistance protein